MSGGVERVVGQFDVDVFVRQVVGLRVVGGVEVGGESVFVRDVC